MDATSRRASKRPVYLNLLAIRQPIPAVASILHRISGAVLFFFGVPVALWAVQTSLASPEAYAGFVTLVRHPAAKLATLVLVWAYLHHLFAGIRHLLQDIQIGIELKPARLSATAGTVAAIVLTLIVGARLW
jgi:succinate dehydrogenase / fumarate reductase, cytochrome b subunit